MMLAAPEPPSILSSMVSMPTASLMLNVSSLSPPLTFQEANELSGR